MGWASNGGGDFNSAGPSTIRCANGPPPHRKSMGRIRYPDPPSVTLNSFQGLNMKCWKYDAGPEGVQRTN